MLIDIKPRHKVETVSYALEFTDADGAGYSFPCDEKGNLYALNECSRANYEEALRNPEDYVTFNKVIPQYQSYTEPASGTCVCKATVELVDEYLGACQCSRCGRWYNLFGQELCPPEMWMED